jgi:uncharacterized membrane protein
MAAQKQAKRKRQAVSAKKRTSHGNNRGRAPVSYDPPPAVPASTMGQRMGLGALRTAAGRGVGGSVIGTPESTGGTAMSLGDLNPAAPLPLRMLSWVRDHPLKLAVWLLSIAGLGVSIYLTITHYDTSVTIACSDKGVINCEKVTTSAQSMVFGVFPVAVLGLAFYCFMAVINSPFGWRFAIPAVRWLRLGSVVVGMGFVLYLVFAEVIQIGNICLWCTSVHVITFLIFVLLVYDATSWTSQGAPRPLTPPGGPRR